ncbi:hypothetical protein [Vagococcus fluvialis]
MTKYQELKDNAGGVGQCIADRIILNGVGGGLKGAPGGLRGTSLSC